MRKVGAGVFVHPGQLWSGPFPILGHAHLGIQWCSRFHSHNFLLCQRVGRTHAALVEHPCNCTIDAPSAPMMWHSSL